MFVWFWVVGHWFPLREGRDMMNYFLCFRDMLQIEPEFPPSDGLSHASDPALLRNVF
jgi:hypothetical protein